MKNRKIIQYWFNWMWYIGLRRLENLPKNLRLIGCADPNVPSQKNFQKNKKLILTDQTEKTIKFKKFRCCYNCNHTSTTYTNYFRMY